MKSLDADKKASKTSEAAPAVAASVSAASAQLDLSKVKIDPLFEEYVDFDTFAKSDFRVVKIEACEAVPKSKKLLKFTALDFIKKFNNRIFVLDASQYGINELGELAEYLEPMFYNNVIGVFNNLIADARKHPLTTRRYMWKFPY